MAFLRAGAVLALAAALVAVTLPGAPALEPVDGFTVYGDWEGAFLAGGPWNVGRVTGGPGGVVDAGPVNRASHAFTVNDCHRDVRIALEFTPTAFEADADLVAVGVPFTFEAWLVDAVTGARVHDAPMTWRSPGASTVRLADAGAFELDLRMRQGADAEYALRVTGWRSVDAECRHQGRVLVTEVEANPDGTDAGAEWIEVLNAGFDTVDLAGWRVDALAGRPASLELPDGLVLDPGARVIVRFDAQFVDNVDEVVTLTAPRGWVVDRTPALTDTANDARAWQRVPDTGEEWAFLVATPGAAAEP